MEEIDNDNQLNDHISMLSSSTENDSHNKTENRKMRLFFIYNLLDRVYPISRHSNYSDKGLINEFLK